jgi:serine/threonine protein kinase
VTTAKHRKTGSKYALKSIAVGAARSTTSLDEFLQEIDIHKSLDHPNIARLQVGTAYNSNTHMLYIVALCAMLVALQCGDCKRVYDR